MLILLSAFSLIVDSCSPKPGYREQCLIKSPPPAGGKIQREDDSALDDVIRRAVEMHLFSDGFLNRHDVSVRVKSGNVLLQGAVSSLRAKDVALQLTGQVRGVREIDDRLVLRFSPRPITEIDQDVRRLIAADAVASRLPVRIKVTSEGSVTLSGKVPLWGQKQMVAWIVEGVSGVQKIENQITVIVPQPVPARVVLASEIRDHLKINSWLFDSKLSVTVKGKTAELKGFVASHGERQEAYRTAMVPGIEAVDISQVQVDWYAHAPVQSNLVAWDQFDRETVTRLSRLLSLDPRLAISSVNVKMKNGEAILEGAVLDLKSKNTAERIAQGIVGIRSIRNDLQVKVVPIQGLDRIFESDSDLRVQKISASLEGDQVVLRGSVAQRYEASMALDLVSRIEGVQKVKNELRVLKPIATRSGRELEDRLRLLIVANPIVPTGVLLDTKVKGHSVQYSGQVSSLAEELLVVRDALTAGARQVEPFVTVSRGMPKLTKRYVVSPVPMNNMGWSSFSGSVH